MFHIKRRTFFLLLGPALTLGALAFFLGGSKKYRYWKEKWFGIAADVQVNKDVALVDNEYVEFSYGLDDAVDATFSAYMLNRWIITKSEATIYKTRTKKGNGNLPLIWVPRS